MHKVERHRNGRTWYYVDQPTNPVWTDELALATRFENVLAAVFLAFVLDEWHPWDGTTL